MPLILVIFTVDKLNNRYDKSFEITRSRSQGINQDHEQNHQVEVMIKSTAEIRRPRTNDVVAAVFVVVVAFLVLLRLFLICCYCFG